MIDGEPIDSNGRPYMGDCRWSNTDAYRLWLMIDGRRATYR